MDTVFSHPGDRAAARSAITELLHRYAYMAAENADFPGMAQLFTSDGIFVLPGGTPVPCTEIHRVVRGEPPTFIRHHITTIEIEFSSPTRAAAESLFIAYTDAAQPDHWGRWRDTFSCENGRWLLTKKQPVVEGFAPHGLWAKVMNAESGTAP